MIIQRWVATEDGTLGRAGEFYTLEEEDLQNRQNVSRIPAGTYKCVRTQYIKGGYETFEITYVSGRTRILFHRGNTEEDTEGCILLGTTVGVLKVKDEDSGEWVHKLSVLNSRTAHTAFMHRYKGMDSFWLDIIDED